MRAVERAGTLLKQLKKDYPELKLRPVFSRFGPRSGQCELTTDLKKIVVEFPEMLAGEIFNREGAQRWNSTSGRNQEDEGLAKSFLTADGVKQFRRLLIEIKLAEKDGEKEIVSKLRKEADELERKLLDPELKLYCGDVQIEFRSGVLKYESLRRLQLDPRLPSELNEVGTIRVVAGALKDICDLRQGKDEE